MKGLISKKTLESVAIIVPSREQQDAFGHVFDVVGTQLKHCQKRGEEITELFASLQHRAFSGEL
jgi:hypothetical protein